MAIGCLIGPLRGLGPSHLLYLLAGDMGLVGAYIAALMADFLQSMGICFVGKRNFENFILQVRTWVGEEARLHGPVLSR